MKKLLLSLLILLLLTNKSAMAATGNSRDGLFLILFFVGVLVVLYLIFSAIDFFSKNGKRLVLSFWHLIQTEIHKIFRSRKIKHFEAGY